MITRQLVERRDIYAVADFFRQSPWTVEDLRAPLVEHLMAEVRARVAALPVPERVIVLAITSSTRQR